MKVGDLITQIRAAINDTRKIEYTDDELIIYINQSQDYIANTAINAGYKGFLKTATLQLTDGEADLPSDFVRENAVLAGTTRLLPISTTNLVTSSTYQIVGNKLKTQNDEVTLVYYAYPQQYLTVNDELQLPQHFINLLKEMTIFLALNRNEFNTGVEQQLSALYEQKLLRLIKNYGLWAIPRELPFEV